MLNAVPSTVKVETISTTLVGPNDKVELDLSEPSEPKIAPCEILYEDKDLLICNKSAGLICENSVFEELFRKAPLFLVHRLDKETSGVLILSKSLAVKEKMIPLFEKKEIKKTYLALVAGKVKKETGMIETFLEKKLSLPGKTIYGSGKTGKPALTFWKLLKQGKDASLLVCEPITGRTHQLRIHLSEMGHPIIGDHTYTKQSKNSTKRHMLHAYSIVFCHPIQNKKLKITAKLPQDFLKAHEKYISR